MTTNNARQENSLEHEKWLAEKSFRERELALKEQEQTNRDAELELKRKEQKISVWRNPLFVAVIAATLAAAGNAVVSFLNGKFERKLEEEKSEQTRILEMIKTGDPDKAANNLQFLLESGLISNAELKIKLSQFLATRKPGSGPTLPSQAPPPVGSIIGQDDAVNVEDLDAGNKLRKTSTAVGQIKGLTNDNTVFVCTSFLVAPDLVLTAAHCIQNTASAELFMFDGTNDPPKYKINLPALEIASNPHALSYALLKVNGDPGNKHGVLRLSSGAPTENQQLSILMFRSSHQKLAVTGNPDCRVFKLETDVFLHRCDTGPGSSGSPILNADGEVVGLHFQRDQQGGVATRIDRLISNSHTLQSRR